MRQSLTRVLGIAGVLVVTLAGCAQSASDGEGTVDEVMTFATGKDTTGYLEDLVEEWNEEHPDKAVRLIELSGRVDEQRQSMVQNFLARSDAYDIVNMDVTWTAEFASKGWIVELPDEELPLDEYFSVVVDTARWRGDLYAAPYTTEAGLLYYRSDLVDKPPRTWEALRKACGKADRPDDMACYAGQFAQYEGLTANFTEVVHAAGGRILSPDGREVVVDSPRARAGLRFLTEGVARGHIPRAAVVYQEEQGQDAFQNGDLLFLRNWPYMYEAADDPDDEADTKVAGKVDVAPLPGPDGTGSGVLGGRNLAVSSFSPHQRDAVAFIKYVTSVENGRRAFVETSRPPVWKELYDDPELVERYPFLPVLKKSIATAQPRPKTPKYSAVTLAIQKEAHAALQGTKSVEEAIDDMARALEGAVDDAA